MTHSRAELAYFLDARDARKALQEIAEMLHDTLPALVEVLGSTEPRAVTLDPAVLAVIERAGTPTWTLGTPQPAFTEPLIGVLRPEYDPPGLDDLDEPDTDRPPADGPISYLYRVVDVTGALAGVAETWTVGDFTTTGEAQACVVGLDYLDRSGAKAGIYQIRFIQHINP